MSRTVLIVDDDDFVHRLIGRILDKAQVTVVSAMSLEEAEQYIDERLGEFSGILMDGCMNDGGPDTEPLIRLIREKGFEGPLIAMSGLGAYRDMMVKWGCTHKAPKHDAATLMLDLLDD